MISTSEGHVAERVEENVSQCHHHWLIDVAGGSTSKGVCRLCGAERHFTNYLKGTEWEREAASSESVQPVGSSSSPVEESE